ncbi:MAG: hypothetical protein JO043_10640, partial [Candidatus Eremiobacteraeota bacterium]|nr:hypothetical protein [Candidatus Eremiobacteraeota bacterium]
MKFLLLLSLAMLTAAGAPSSTALARSVFTPVLGKSVATGTVQHVVIIVQENRSFDNLFNGYPGADTVAYGMVAGRGRVRLRPLSLAAPYGISHLSRDFFAACDGTARGRSCKMDGFDREVFAGAPRDLPYSFVPHDETKLYFEMAHDYVLADRMFTSHLDASFVSHQYIIAGHAHHAVDLPAAQWGCPAARYDRVPTLQPDRTYGPMESPCFNYSTIGDELDANGLPWRYYADSGGGYIWLAYQAIRHIKDGPDWKTDAVTPSTRFFDDLKDGNLAAVTWITPSCINSDHGGCGSTTGPHWVANLVNAIGESPF